MTRLSTLAGLIAACETAVSCRHSGAQLTCETCFNGMTQSLASLRASPPLAESPETIADAADALRISEGRAKWSTDNLPGKDVARARAVLAALDARLEVKP